MMFRKLISNLPFNPSLIGSVAFYASRVNAEEKLRRSGLIAISLALVVQSIAVFSPPSPSLAQSANDVISGGFATQQQAIDQCNSNIQEFRSMLDYFEVSCEDIANAHKTSIRSTDFDKQLYSVGRKPLGITGRANKPTDEHRLDISGNVYYMRHLWAWDSNNYSTYDVLKGVNKQGKTFMLLFSCANIVWVGRYEPPAPLPSATPPKLNITKEAIWGSPAPGSKITRGQTLYFRIRVSNIGGSVAHKITIGDQLSIGVETTHKGNFAFTKAEGGQKISSDNQEFWLLDKLYPGGGGYTDIGIKVKADAPLGKLCNVAGVFSSNTSLISSNLICYQVVKSDTTSPPVTVPPPPVLSPVATPPPVFPCDESQDEDDFTACIIMGKKASNITRNIINANGTTAHAGDTISYQLDVKNTSDQVIENFVVQENVSDILEYTDIVDLNGGILSGQNIVTWPAQNISPNSELQKTFVVKIKDTIPQTPVSSSDQNSFDLTLTNTYGNTVSIKLPPSIVKSTEQVIKTLPSTGLAENVIAVAVIVGTSSYFFARSWLMKKELQLIKDEYLERPE
jgi:uncharacterized repeat protein (TIGR01451 family)